jgi:phosphopantetheine--protein transferase-like protein
MNEPDNIRSVVARFFNGAKSEVAETFVFSAERLQGSVARATLRAALKRVAGVDLPASLIANTYGQLLNQATPPEKTELAGSANSGLATNETASEPAGDSLRDTTVIGIDIEHSDSLPWSGEPGSDAFYVENFTTSEIAHCLRQPNPRLFFCGLWSAKEAAIKCGQEFASLRPKDIEIIHDEKGRPAVRITTASCQVPAGDCLVSISHSGKTCVAVCVKAPQSKPVPDAI